ncbi:MAG: RNA polymerase sigma factor [Planctomycetota bacterium]|jgi:RNA polymerase sigma-70 factor (ECF subfamily)
MSEQNKTSPSFCDLERELREPLRAYLAQMLGDHDSAEDLLQESLLRIARGLPSFDGRSSAKTWAFRIATNLVADHFRRPENRGRVVEMESPQEVEDRHLGIESKLILGEMSACIRKCIDSLPEDYRAALVLHDLEGMSAAESAEVMNCSLATAKIRIHRARRRMKRMIGAACELYRSPEDHLLCERRVWDEENWQTAAQEVRR